MEKNGLETTANGRIGLPKHSSRPMLDASIGRLAGRFRIQFTAGVAFGYRGMADFHIR